MAHASMGLSTSSSASAGRYPASMTDLYAEMDQLVAMFEDAGLVDRRSPVMPWGR